MTRREAVFGVAAAGMMKFDVADCYRGRIEASKVASLMSSEGLSRDELMIRLLPVAKRHAHPPISNYFVGAVALGSSGSLYLGQNIEIPGNMLGLAVHAEQSAIANAYMSDETGVEAIAVSAPPCGHCRQFLSEVLLESRMRVLIPNSPAMLLSDLLPLPFGPKNLGLKAGAFPVARKYLPVCRQASDDLSRQAYGAAGKSYAPYSKSPSGVALATSTGQIFAGSYIENAAFNPSLPPLESALAGYFASGSLGGQIQRVVLVEVDGNVISHEVTTRSVLKAIASGAGFERITCSAVAA